MFSVGDVVVFTPEAKIVHAHWHFRHNEFKVLLIHGNIINFCINGSEKNGYGYGVYSLTINNFQHVKPKVLVELEDML